MARNLGSWFSKQQGSKKSGGKKSLRRRRNPLRNSTLGLEWLEERALLAAGDLDTTFNPGGTIPGIKIGQFAPFGVGADSDEGVMTAVQADGKIVVATQTLLTGFNVNYDVMVARYNPDGSADTTFGSGGSTSFDFTSGQSLLRDIAIDNLGRIIVVGSAPVAPSIGFAVARLTSSGVLDTTFDGDGKVTNNFGGVPSEAFAVGIQADGKIVVGGVAGAGNAGNFAVVRFNTNGSLDDGTGADITPGDQFGTNGRVTTDFFARRDIVQDLAIQADGRIVVVGSVDTGANPAARDFGLVRYNADGTLDTSFDLDGKVTTNIVTTALVPGITFSEDIPYSVKVQADGRIIVAGVTTLRSGAVDNSDMTVARYNTDGSLDVTFLPDPARPSEPGTHRVNVLIHEFAKEILIQPDGKYVVAGMANSTSSGPGNFTITIARLQTNGSLDTTFSGDGIQQTSLDAAYQPGQTRVYHAAFQPDGKVVVVGSSAQTAGPNFIRDYFIARYETELVTATIAGAASVAEAATYTLNLNSSDPTTTQWTINWGNGTEVVAGNPSSVTHVYADGPQNYTISATVTTSTGTSTVGNTVAVSVLNVSPTLAISGASTVNEGASYVLNLSSTDPGADTITQWTINWGDNTEIVSGNPSSVTHTYADGSNNYVISATATDEDGTFMAGNTVVVAVNNVAPTLALSGAADVDEASPYTLNLSSFDPGTDAITQWTINWGDGTEIVSGNPTSVSHTYADGDANYTISATATDEDGTHAAGNTVAVLVHNVAPTLAISGAADVDEGDTYTLNLSSLDPGTDTITQWTINWGDGTEVVSGNPASVTHTYADGDANYTVSATATDEDGTFAAGNTVAVMVHDVGPALAISGDSDVDEGDTYTLNLSSLDPGTDTITQWTINWGDGTEVVSGNPASVTHTYADGDANYTVSATATDEDGTHVAGNTVDVAVHNVDPTLAISGAADVDEGASYTLNLSSLDPGADTITSWTINWGDATEIVTGNPINVTHTYADGDNNYTISATATDEDGTFAAIATVAVLVHNVAPALAISGNSDVNEGSSYTLNLSSLDPGADTITSWTINWGDATEIVTGNPASVTHTYADGDANYTISATATDEDGTYAAGNTVAVAVHNVAPTLTISGAASVNEGASYTLNLSSLDPGVDTITSWTINWGDGTQVVSGNPTSVTHTYADGNAGYTISATATDEDGTFAAGNTVAVTVHNVAPTINSLAITPAIDANQTATLTGTYSDAGTFDTHQLDIDWNGDGVYDQTVVVSGGAFSVNRTYTSAGTFNVKVRVRDNDGGASGVTVVQVSVLGVGNTLVGGVLHIVGANQNDVVTIDKHQNQIRVLASFVNFVPAYFNLASVTQIHVRVYGGNDVVAVSNSLTTPTIVDGGSGNDVLTAGGGNTYLLGGSGNDVLAGGPGNNVLVGGDGADVITGGNGRDLIIGGDNSDVLSGGAGDDILIGGWTVHDNNIAALSAIMNVWTSSASFNARVAALNAVGGLLEPNVAVFNDGDSDVLSGGSARDLIFANTNLWSSGFDAAALQLIDDLLVTVA